MTAHQPTGVDMLATRTIDFARAVAPTQAGGRAPLLPYQAVAPGLRVGYENDRGAVVTLEKHDGRPPIVDVAEIGNSRWLTFEVDVDARALQRTHAVHVTLVVAAAPRQSVRSMVRLWRDQSTFDEVEGPPLIVGAASIPVSQTIGLTAHYGGKVPDAVGAQLLLFLPPVAARYILYNMTVTPSPV